MIGLGLALSAKHVFDDHRAAFDAGDAVGLCIGVRGDGSRSRPGTCTQWPRSPNGTDLQLLSLRLVSDMPTDGDFSTIPLTTRVPARGEHLTIVGFRFDDEPASTDSIVESRCPQRSSIRVAGRGWPIQRSSTRFRSGASTRRSKFSAEPSAE